MAGRGPSQEEMNKTRQGNYYEEPALGIPYGYPPPAPGHPSIGHGYLYPPPMTQAPPQQTVQYGYQPGMYRQQAGMPANAIYGPPNGILIRETFFADTPAPFECPHCGKSGMTSVKSSPSLAACIACMVSLVGVCFLCKSCDCLWHKEHYCQNCNQKVGEYKKSDPCLVADPMQWQTPSFALPA